LWRLADERKIQYPAGAPKTDMLKIFEANGLDLAVPIKVPGVDWVQINGQDANGAAHSEIYPVIPDHYTKDKNIDYAAAMQANEKLSEEQIFEKTRLEAQKKSFNFPLDKLLPWQLNHMCKDAGIDPIPKDKEGMLAALEGGNDVENAVERS